MNREKINSKKNCREWRKNVIYFLLYNGVPENVVPLILEATKNYNTYTIKKMFLERKEKIIVA
ncbi:hypothetical protein [uncultured Methanobrevibacter sp.]|uniref:hypothetical protein n=1 Tax=uncultured Methanobrevibacter sp. TaxID=253161 RepID=UPI0025DF329B|nr:hypothetical protein [uncultured Methanobrevibacter sp.]